MPSFVKLFCALFLCLLCSVSLSATPVTTYYFDFHYNAGSVTSAQGTTYSFAPTDIVYKASSANATTLTYDTGSLDGVIPSTGGTPNMLTLYTGQLNYVAENTLSNTSGGQLVEMDFFVPSAPTTTGTYPSILVNNAVGAARTITLGGGVNTQLRIGGTLTITTTEPLIAATPEPSSLLLAGTGALCIALRLRRRSSVA